MYFININNEKYKIEFMQNKTAKEIIKILPLKLSMQPYSNIEYYGTLEDNLVFDEEYTTKVAEENMLMYCKEYNALVIVCKKHHDLFYEIPIGKIYGKVKVALKKDIATVEITM